MAEQVVEQVAQGTGQRFSLLERVRRSRNAAAVSDSSAAQLTAEMAAARRRGLLGLLRLRFEAWLEERMKEAIIRKLEARQAVLEAQQKTTEAENRLRTAIKSGQKEVERHEIEWSQLRRQRLVTDLERCGITIVTSEGNGAAPAPPADAGSAPVSVHITDEQIEALALRAVMHLGQEDGEGDTEWERYRAELFERLPQYAAAEVEQRVKELRELAR